MRLCTGPQPPVLFDGLCVPWMFWVASTSTSSARSQAQIRAEQVWDNRWGVLTHALTLSIWCGWEAESPWTDPQPRALVNCWLLDGSPQHTQFCSGVKGVLWHQADGLQAVFLGHFPSSFVLPPFNIFFPVLHIPVPHPSFFEPALIFPKCSNSFGTKAKSNFFYPRLFTDCKFLLIHSLSFFFTLLSLSIFRATKLLNCMLLLSGPPSTHRPFLLVLLYWYILS